MAKWSDATTLRKTEEFEKSAKEFAGMGLQLLEDEYAKAREAKADLEEMEKPINHRIMVLELILCEKFAEEGIKTTTFDDGARITVGFETDYSIENKPTFLEWIKATGREHLLTVMAQTAKSLAKELAVEAQVNNQTFVLPPGMVASDPIPKLTFTPKK